MADFLNTVNKLIPVDSPTRKNHRKRILLVGGTGSGKSTIASILINGDVKQGFNENNIFVSNGQNQGTFSTKVVSNDQYVITDTIGFPSADESKDPFNPFSTLEAVQQLKNFLIHSRSGYHLIVFVTKLGRLTKQQHAVFNMLYNGLFADLKAHFVLVATNVGYKMTPAERKSFAADYDLLPMCPVDFNIVEGDDRNIPVVFEAYSQKTALYKKELETFIKDHIPRDKKVAIPKCASLERKAWYTFIKWILNFLGLAMFDDEVKNNSVLDQ